MIVQRRQFRGVVAESEINMSQAAEPALRMTESSPNRVRWTRSQCEALQETGLLTGRYELVNGEIISKMGQKPPHATAVTRLNGRLVALFGALHVRIQSTIEIGNADPSYNEPEPDAAVTAKPEWEYQERHPGPEDLVLVVEVADSTLRFDCTTKATLYALAGIREYWVLDLNGRRILVHRQPASGGYLDIKEYGADESVATAALPQDPLRVSELLPLPLRNL